MNLVLPCFCHTLKNRVCLKNHTRIKKSACTLKKITRALQKTHAIFATLRLQLNTMPLSLLSEREVLLPTITLAVFLLLSICVIVLWKSKRFFTIMRIKRSIVKKEKLPFLEVIDDLQKETRLLNVINGENSKQLSLLFSSTTFSKLYRLLIDCPSKNDFIRGSLAEFCRFCGGENAFFYWEEDNERVLRKKMDFFSDDETELNVNPFYEKDLMIDYGKESSALKNKSNYLISLEKKIVFCMPLTIFYGKDLRLAKIAGLIRIDLGQRNLKSPEQVEEIKKIRDFFCSLSFFYGHMLSHYQNFHQNILNGNFFSMPYFSHLAKTLKKIDRYLVDEMLSWKLIGVVFQMQRMGNDDKVLGKIKSIGEEMKNDSELSFTPSVFLENSEKVILIGFLQKNNDSDFLFNHVKERFHHHLKNVDVKVDSEISLSINFIGFKSVLKIMQEKEKSLQQS